jgi:hypothetical protein
MTPSRAFALDSVLAVCLALALGLVYLLDRAPPTLPVTVTPIPVVLTPETPAAPPLRLAVTPHQYDDMGKLLRQLGSGFNYTEISLDDLQDVSKLVSFDVVFLTCGTVPESWSAGDVGVAGDRPGVRLIRLNEQIVNRVKEALRTFVGRGGTLYASDWRLDQLNWTFPELFDQEPIVPGEAQTLTAEVVDPGLRDLLGPSVELKFDLPGWKPARFSGSQVTVYLRGSYLPHGNSSAITAPLLIKVPFQQGTIIFTSFHNEKVNSELETKLLRFLVFAAVTAKETAQTQKTMISGGFPKQKTTMISASAASPSVTQTYANSKQGRLRFALSFRDQGAQLRLTVRGPGGQTQEQVGTSTFTVDVPDAAPGNWTYTVTAVKVPYENFPFTLTVGSD